MPSSNLALAPDVLAMVDQVPHRRILDIGPGHGKYSVLLREYLRQPPETIDAVEAWPAYVEAFDLEVLYRTVIVGSAIDQPVEILENYDLVLLVDVLEHFTLADGTDFLARIPGRVVICTPVEFFQNPEADEIWTEEHRSHWTEADFVEVASIRGCDLEVCYQNLGGWLVRFGPRS